MCAWELLNNQNSKQGEVLVCIPYKDKFSARFVAGLIGLQYPNGFAHSVFFETGQPVDVARNIMVSNGLQRDVSHLFFLDQDVIVKPDTLTELITPEMPIISAVYFSRAPPYNVVANIRGNPLTRDDIVNRLEKAPGHQALMEVHEAGAGSLLVDIRVFKRIADILDLKWSCMLRHPGKLDEIEKDDSVIMYSNSEAIELNYRCKYCDNTLVSKFFDYRIGKEKDDALSEDYYFNKLCRKVGFSIYLSIHTSVEHEIPFFTINENGIMNSSVGAGIIR